MLRRGSHCADVRIILFMVCCCNGTHTGFGGENRDDSTTPTALTHLRNPLETILNLTTGLVIVCERTCVPQHWLKRWRKIAVVWIPDVHVTAKMSDLFEVSLFLFLMSRFCTISNSDQIRSCMTTMHLKERMNCCEMSKSTR